MRVISKKAIVACYTKHAEGKDALEEWFKKTEDADWTTFEDIKQTFNSVDSVGNDRYVFNIKGNKFRLVALILFKWKMLYIRFVGTHSEYDDIDCKNV